MLVQVVLDQGTEKGFIMSACLWRMQSIHRWIGVQVVHFIRHGEGFHNIGFPSEDAQLTEAGWQQTAALKRHLRQHADRLRIEVWILDSCTPAHFPVSQLAVSDSWTSTHVA